MQKVNAEFDSNDVWSYLGNSVIYLLLESANTLTIKGDTFVSGNNLDPICYDKDRGVEVRTSIKKNRRLTSPVAILKIHNNLF